jgi:hypothetical protein
VFFDVLVASSSRTSKYSTHNFSKDRLNVIPVSYWKAAFPVNFRKHRTEKKWYEQKTTNVQDLFSILVFTLFTC